MLEGALALIRTTMYANRGLLLIRALELIRAACVLKGALAQFAAFMYAKRCACANQGCCVTYLGRLH